jgi:hypothetical protein
VADPAKADLFDLSHAGCVCNGGFSESGKFRVDGVHEASINVHSGGPEDKQDRDSDGKANDRVGLRESGQDAKCAGDDSEGSEPVCSRVQTVGNKSRRADLPADADPVDGDVSSAETPQTRWVSMPIRMSMTVLALVSSVRIPIDMPGPACSE